MNKLIKKEKNYGIACLRVALSFMVVLDHFFDKTRKQKFKHILSYTNILFNVILLYT